MRWIHGPSNAVHAINLYKIYTPSARKLGDNYDYVIKITQIKKNKLHWPTDATRRGVLPAHRPNINKVFISSFDYMATVTLSIYQTNLQPARGLVA